MTLETVTQANGYRERERYDELFADEAIEAQQPVVDSAPAVVVEDVKTEQPLRIGVRALDVTKKGAHGERRRILELLRSSQDLSKAQTDLEKLNKRLAASDESDPTRAADQARAAALGARVLEMGLAVEDEQERIIRRHCFVLDEASGETLEDALDELAETDYQALLGAILSGAQRSAVNPTNAPPSPIGPKV